MKSQLLEKGLTDAVFDPGDGRRYRGEQMTRLCGTLASMEEALLALERRGVNLKTHAERLDPRQRPLAIFHVFLGRDEHWFSIASRLGCVS